MKARNVIVFLGAAVATYIVWLYGGHLWNKQFLLNRTFEGVVAWYFYTWGYDALLLFVAGASLALVIRSSRRTYWAAALGATISLLHLLETRWILFDWSLDNVVWNVGRYLIPVITASLGGLVVDRLAPSPSSNNRWRGP